MTTNKKMLAFIHIEKAAGQTFIRIMENNYIFRHCRVAPLRKEHLGVFNWADLRMLLRINPFLNAIAGHSIFPYSDLKRYLPDVRYVTILRDPVKRYISHYQYWVQVLKKKISFDEFLSLDETKDFQTKKIAGVADAETAQRIILEDLFLCGMVEKFDAFLKVLQKKMVPEHFDIRYQRKNVAKSNRLRNQIFENFKAFQDQILENNQNDIVLYDFVKNKVFKDEEKKWADKNISTENIGNTDLSLRFLQEFIGRLYRNLYMGPIINVIRYKNGLRIGGSY